MLSQHIQGRQQEDFAQRSRDDTIGCSESPDGARQESKEYIDSQDSPKTLEERRRVKELCVEMADVCTPMLTDDDGGKVDPAIAIPLPDDDGQPPDKPVIVTALFSSIFHACINIPGGISAYDHSLLVARLSLWRIGAPILLRVIPQIII